MSRNGPGFPWRLFSLFRGSWSVYLLVLIIFSCGIFLGSLFALNMDNNKSGELSQYVGSFIKNAETIDFQSSQMAHSAIKNNIIITISIYLLGLTIIGVPIILAILFARGFILGFAVCFLTRDMSFEGILLTVSSILPHNMLYIPAIYLASVLAVIFSVTLWKRNFDSGIPIWPRLLNYTGLMFLVLIIAVLAGLVEGYGTPYFTKIATGFIARHV